MIDSYAPSIYVRISCRHFPHSTWEINVSTKNAVTRKIACRWFLIFLTPGYADGTPAATISLGSQSTGPTTFARLGIPSTEGDLGTLQSRLVFRTVIRLYPDAERSTLCIYITYSRSITFKGDRAVTLDSRTWVVTQSLNFLSNRVTRSQPKYFSQRSRHPVTQSLRSDRWPLKLRRLQQSCPYKLSSMLQRESIW